jgi:TorA maturation chaperone TorD
MIEVTNTDKERFLEILTCLFSPPEREMAELVHQQSLHSFFNQYFEIWREDSNLLEGFLMKGDMESIFTDLKKEHNRLFSSETGKENISLVESFYKPWTQDPRCSLPFATGKGLLMGDSALHLMVLYQQCGLELGGEYRGMPDHLVMELEFLSFLYQRVTDKEIKRFIEDHLDWIALLREKFKEFHSHPFYQSALEVLLLFLRKEKERLEVECHG